MTENTNYALKPNRQDVDKRIDRNIPLIFDGEGATQKGEPQQ